MGQEHCRRDHDYKAQDVTDHVLAVVWQTFVNDHLERREHIKEVPKSQELQEVYLVDTLACKERGEGRQAVNKEAILEVVLDNRAKLIVLDVGSKELGTNFNDPKQVSNPPEDNGIHFERGEHDAQR